MVLTHHLNWGIGRVGDQTRGDSVVSLVLLLLTPPVGQSKGECQEEVAMSSNKQVLAIWESLWFDLNPEMSRRFLEKPEVRLLAAFPEHRVRHAVASHQKVSKALQHLRTEVAGHRVDVKVVRCPCGCHFVATARKRMDDKKAQASNQFRYRRSGPSKRTREGADNLLPFDSLKYGGPRVRNPPAPPGSIDPRY